ncbi:MAG: HAAS signaling domain-containing protein [Terriglobales bacterium]
MATELIDRYVHEVGEHLPGRMRADVQTELRSLLMDTVEERASAAGRPMDSELMQKVLREFGPPEEVAARYAPPAQYLIGPRLFPTYKLVVGIMALVVGALMLAFFVTFVVTGILKAIHGPAGAPHLPIGLGVFGKILFTAIFNFGLVTLAFAIAEHIQAHRAATGEAWDPTLLPPVDDPDRISPVGHVFSLYGILVLAALFNFVPGWVGIYWPGGGSWRVTPLLLPEFAFYMPMLNVWWGLAFAFNLLVLRQGRWTRQTRWAEFALGLLSGGIWLLIVLGPRVFHYDWIAKTLLKGVLVIVVIEACVRLYRLLLRRAAEIPLGAQPAPSPGAARQD